VSDFLIDDGTTRDLIFTAGDLTVLTGPEARAQRIRIALRHLMGEWFLDQTSGTDYFGQILGKSSELSRRAEYRRRILGVPGVVEIASMQLTVDPKTRQLSGTITAIDVTGVPLETDVKGTP
jgi:hypothetical protein